MDEDEYRERRAHPRFDCSGEASLRVRPTWPAVRGSIVNLCLGGCMVEFMSRQKIEIGQKVELIFNVHNLPFHVQAVSRGERGKLQYGFEFPALRERVRLQLLELIEELEQGGVPPEWGINGLEWLK